MTDPILIGKGDTPQFLLPAYANRHGLIAGATGTGKTITLQGLAEGFADIGVPVFAADIKGDLSGIAAAGEAKPKLVFFFDEAHLLFKDAPKALVEKVEQVVRLIRSKGVGVYFITQNPLDLPESVLGQLGNRVQHALRAFTPRDQKAVKAAATTFRSNPKIDVATVITELGVGEALVSTLQDKGVPGIVERTLVRPPRSRMGALTPEERKAVMSRSPVAGKYDSVVDRESAYEKLSQRAAATPPPAAATRWPRPPSRVPRAASPTLSGARWGARCCGASWDR